MKKGQIQIGETIAVLFVFFILIVVGFVFYARVVKDNVEQEQDELAQLRSNAVALKVKSMPELQCSEKNIVKKNCLDWLKLDIAVNTMNQNELQYFDIFEFSTITVTQVYPPNDPLSDSAIQWVLYSNELANYKNKFVTNIPVKLFLPVSKETRFGIIRIETYLQ